MFKLDSNNYMTHFDVKVEVGIDNVLNDQFVLLVRVCRFS